MIIEITPGMWQMKNGQEVEVESNGDGLFAWREVMDGPARVYWEKNGESQFHLEYPGRDLDKRIGDLVGDDGITIASSCNVDKPNEDFPASPSAEQLASFRKSFKSWSEVAERAGAPEKPINMEEAIETARKLIHIARGESFVVRVDEVDVSVKNNSPYDYFMKFDLERIKPPATAEVTMDWSVLPDWIYYIYPEERADNVFRWYGCIYEAKYTDGLGWVSLGGGLHGSTIEIHPDHEPTLPTGMKFQDALTEVPGKRILCEDKCDEVEEAEAFRRFIEEDQDND